MIGFHTTHFQIVEQAVKGERELDEQTFASMEILDERLKRLKAQDEAFSNVEFSPEVQRLKERKKPVAAH